MPYFESSTKRKKRFKSESKSIDLLEFNCESFTNTKAKPSNEYRHFHVFIISVFFFQDSDGDFGRQIDYFFLRFRTSSLFTKAPENVEEYLRRSIQAHNLTRVQQNVRC